MNDFSTSISKYIYFFLFFFLLLGAEMKETTWLKNDDGETLHNYTSDYYKHTHNKVLVFNISVLC